MLNPTRRSQEQKQGGYCQMATLAVEQEKEGHWCEAAALWEFCAEIAYRAPNLAWAQYRADFCRQKDNRLNNRLNLISRGEQ